MLPSGEEKKKPCMATDMHTDGSHRHGNPNSTLHENSFLGSNREKLWYLALEKHRHLKNYYINLFEVLLCVWQVGVLKAGACGEGGGKPRAALKKTHHATSLWSPTTITMALILDFPLFCVQLLRCWLWRASIMTEEEVEGKQGGGVRADNSVNYTVVSSLLADNWTCNHNRSLFSILQSQTLWWGLEKVMACESRSHWPSDTNHPQITTVHPVRQKTTGKTPEFKFNITATANDLSHRTSQWTLGLKWL